jgi:hypothetical protein
LVAIVLAWIVIPLLGREQRALVPQSTVARQRERLEIYYARILRNIRDLDEDHATGKLNTKDYEQERELWAQRGVAVLAALDQLDAEHLIAPSAADDSTIDRQIEKLIESYK